MCGSCTGIQFGDPSAGHFTGSNSAVKSSGGMNEGSTTDSRPFTSQSGSSMSRSGSIAEDPKFTGASSNDEKFDGQKSNSGNNPSIGQQGWGS
jgi:hypothetical protein